MTMKVSAEDIFEKDQSVDEAQLAKLVVYRNRLRVAFGIALGILLVTPDLLYFDSPLPPLIMIALLFWGTGQALYLLLVPKWRRVPLAERREVIVWSLAVGTSIFAFIALVLMFSGDNEAPVFILLAVLLWGGLYALNKRWSRSAETDAELFP